MIVAIIYNKNRNKPFKNKTKLNVKRRHGAWGEALAPTYRTSNVR